MEEFFIIGDGELCHSRCERPIAFCECLDNPFYYDWEKDEIHMKEKQ